MIEKFLVPSAFGEFKDYSPIFIALCLLFLLSIVLVRFSKKWPLGPIFFKTLAGVVFVGILIYLFRFERALTFDSNLWIWSYWPVAFGTIAVMAARSVFLQSHTAKVHQKITTKEKYLPKPSRR